MSPTEGKYNKKNPTNQITLVLIMANCRAVSDASVGGHGDDDGDGLDLMESGCGYVRRTEVVVGKKIILRICCCWYAGFYGWYSECDTAVSLVYFSPNVYLKYLQNNRKNTIFT